MKFNKIFSIKHRNMIAIMFLMIFNLFPIIAGCSNINNRNPFDFGIPTNDGTAIQVYYQEQTIIKQQERAINVRVPQDTNLLEFEYFYILIDVRDSIPRHVTVEYYRINETDHPINLLLSRTFSIESEDNEWDDPRYGQVRIDDSNFEAFTQTDEKKMFIIRYNNVNFFFYHLTNPALVEVPVTRGNLASTVLMYGILSLIYLTVMAAAAAKVKNKLGTWMSFDFSSVALIFTWLIVGLLGIALAQGMTESDIMRQFISVPAATMLLFASAILALWIPSFFTEQPSKLHVIKYVPNIDFAEIVKNLIIGDPTKDPKSLIKIGYEQLHVVHTPAGRRFYRNARSLVEIIGSLLHGSTAIRSTGQPVIYEVNLKTKEEFKKPYYDRMKDFIQEKIGELGFHLWNINLKEEIIFVEDYRWKKNTTTGITLLDKILYNFYITSGLFIGFLVGSLLILGYARQSVDFIGVFFSIIMLVYGLYCIFYYTRAYKYLEIDPCPKSALEVIYDSKRLYESEEKILTAIHELKAENLDLEIRLKVVDKLESSKDRIGKEKRLFPASYEENFKGAEKKIDAVIKKVRYDPDALEKDKKTGSKLKGSKAQDGGSVA